MKKAFNYIKEKLKYFYSIEYVKAFIWIYLIGLLCFSVRAAFNYFTLPLGGDYTLQTYAFYSQGYHIFWDFIKTGDFPLFDFSNFLGANYLGTQSFYYVFSPLFYLLCLCPEPLLYQGIFFHMVLKFAVGGFFMYVLLRKYFHVTFKMSWLGGFIYAFSGWALFYVWFHFGDAMAFFPLFIIGIEKCLQERKGMLLSISLMLCGLANYFFLVNFCIFGVFYALYRWIHIYGINKKRGYDAKFRWGVLLQGVLHYAVGVLMAAIVILPSLHVVQTSTRSTTSQPFVFSILQAFFIDPQNGLNGFVLGDFKSLGDILAKDNLKHLFNTLFVWQDRTVSSSTLVAGKTHVGYILSSWLYMNTNCWDNIMFDNVSLDNAIGGFFITTPLTMLLIPSIVNAFKTKRPWTIFGVVMCLILPFLPITAHLSFGFTSLYGRWQLWLVLLGILFIIPTLDSIEKVNRKWITVNLIFNYVLAIIIYFISKQDGKLPTGYDINVFGLKIPGMMFVTIIELIVMALVWFFYRFKTLFSPAILKHIMTIIVVVEIGASCVITVENKSYAKWENYYLSQPQYAELEDIISSLQKDDEDFYRIFNTEATRSITNMPSALNYNGASTFNSTYNFELDDFIDRSRMAYGGSWSMGNHEKRYWFDQYIGTKYYIVDKLDINNDNANYKYSDENLAQDAFFNGKTRAEEQSQDYLINVPFGYELYKEYDYFYVYQNTNYHGIGYSVDSYILSSTVGTGKYSTYYEELYTTLAVIEDENEEKIIEDLPDINKKSAYYTKYKSFNFSNNWNLYFSPRNDVSYFLEKDYERHTYKLNSSTFRKDEITQYINPSSFMFHKRWEEKERFGDQLIMETKNGIKLCEDASKDNMCYITFSLKLGPKALVSFYNGDVLVTQDAHMNSNSSLNKDSYEWKHQRGYYVDQPFDKIVIEFIADMSFDKVFNSSDTLTNLNITYTYQDDIKQIEQTIKNNLIEDVTYSSNKFEFKTTTDKEKLYVTNIPYDKGWTLKANGQKMDIIKVNGGFIGFIAPEGETTYKLTYFTPNLGLGLIATGIGIMLLVLLCFLYRNKKSSYLEDNTALNYAILKEKEEAEKKELESFKKRHKK